MKKVIFSAAIFFAAIATNAQDAYSAGNIMLQGGLGFSNSSSSLETTNGGTTNTAEGPKFSNFNLNVMGGYFVVDRIAVGLGLGFESSKMTDEDAFGTEEEKTNLTVVAPFVRWYAPEITSDFSVFVDLKLGFGFGSMESKETTGGNTESFTQDISTLGVGISPGFSYLVSEGIALTFNYGFLGYNSRTTKADFGGGSSAKKMDKDFGLNLNFNTLAVGCTFFL